MIIVYYRNKVFQQGRVYFVGGAKHGSSSTLGSLLAIHHFGEGPQMEKISLVNNIYHVDATLYVENSAPVIKMELAVKSIVGKSSLKNQLSNQLCSPRTL